MRRTCAREDPRQEPDGRKISLTVLGHARMQRTKEKSSTSSEHGIRQPPLTTTCGLHILIRRSTHAHVTAVES